MMSSERIGSFAYRRRPGHDWAVFFCHRRARHRHVGEGVGREVRVPAIGVAGKELAMRAIIGLFFQDGLTDDA